MSLFLRILLYGLPTLGLVALLGFLLYLTWQQVRSYHQVALFHQLMRQNRLDEALEVIQRATDISPHDGYCYLQRAQIHIKLRNYETALNDYNLALHYSRSGNEAEAYAGRSSVYCCLEKYDQALIDANHAIACNRHAWYAYVARGHTYLGLSHSQIALDDFEQAQQLAIETKAPVCYGLAVALYKLEKYERAFSLAQQAMVLDADNAEVIALVGGALIGCRKYEEALKHLERAQLLAPDLARTYYYTARWYLDQADYSQATAALLQCLKLEQPQIERQEANSLLSSVLCR